MSRALRLVLLISLVLAGCAHIALERLSYGEFSAQHESVPSLVNSPESPSRPDRRLINDAVKYAQQSVERVEFARVVQGW